MKFLIFALLAALISAGTQAQHLMSEVVVEQNTDQPRNILSGDFNGDSKTDIAWWEGDIRNRLNILFNRDNYDFTHYVFEPTNIDSLRYLQVGDFNEDGKNDIIGVDIRSADLQSIILFTSTGDSVTQKTIVDIPNTGRFTGFIVTDFDDDHHLDFVHANTSTGAQVYLGDGSGSFTFSSKLQGLERLPGIIQHVDLNNDQKKDFVSLSPSGTGYNDDVFYDLKVFLNNGDGYNESTVGYNIASNDYSGGVADITMHDFTGDGSPDIAFGNSGVRIYKNQGNGTFTNGSEAEFITNRRINFIDHADYDNDGREDIAAGDAQYSPGLFIGHNTTEGFVASSPTGSRFDFSRGFKFADLDGDGREELVELYWGGINIYKYSAGEWALDKNLILTYHPVQAKILDLNNDGIPDLLSAELESGAMAVRYGKGDLKFDDPVFIETISSVDIDDFETGDFNKDGFVDVVYVAHTEVFTGKTYFQKAETTVILSDGGVFKKENQTRIDTLYSPAVTIGDYNNDANPDFLVWNYIVEGDGQGNFTMVKNTMPEPIELASGDLNGDGLPDILISSIPYDGSTVNSTIFVGLNSGTSNVFPSFSEIKIPFATPYDQIITGDVNNDNKVDFVGNANFINSIFGINKGDGTFIVKEVSVAVFGRPSSNPAIGDINVDGLADVVLWSRNQTSLVPDLEGDVVIHEQQPDGTFLMKGIYSFDPIDVTIYRQYTQYRSVILMDANDDGKPDIVITSATVDGISVIYSQKKPTTSPSNFAVSNITTDSATLSLTKGEGNGRIIIVRKSDQPDILPVADSLLVSSEDYIINHGDITGAILTGLEPGTSYIATAYEYNQPVYPDTLHLEYLTATRAELTFTTLPKDSVIVTGINDTRQQVEIYPNPARNTVNIDVGALELKHDAVSFTDMLGRRQVISIRRTNSGTNTLSIDISTLSKGQYVVEIKTDAGPIRTKVVLE